MGTALQTALKSWEFPFALTGTLLLAGFVYLCGWRRVHSSQPNLVPSWRAGAFVLGLALIWLAVGSPLAAFDEQLLTAHMIQHLLLMTFAPSFLLIGSPILAFLNGLPRGFVQGALGPLFRWTPLHWLGRALVRPTVSWFAAAAALVGWHIPAAFTLALNSRGWHLAEHATFFLAGFFFWWPVIQPTSPARAKWTIILYLFLATLPCDVLSAFLVFGDRLAYSAYLSAPRPLAIGALEDQQFAGALMWTSVTIVYLVPAAMLTIKLLSAHHADELGPRQSALRRIPASTASSPD